MRYVSLYLFWLALGALAGVAQVSFMAPVPLFAPIDVVLIGTFWLFLSGRTQYAVVYGLAGTLAIDTLSGWFVPGHAIVFLLAVAVFGVFSRRLFSSQTAPSMAMNAALATMICILSRSLIGGFSLVSLPEQGTTLASSIPLTIARMIGTAVVIWIVQVFRRRSYTVVSNFPS